jgi:hypothetical protein
MPKTPRPNMMQARCDGDEALNEVNEDKPTFFEIEAYEIESTNLCDV